MTNKRVYEALNRIWATLAPLNIPMAIIGGVGLAKWEHLRSTLDVDLLVGMGSTPIKELIVLLRDAGFRPKKGLYTAAIG
jgi:hypothetical protein